MPENDDSPEEQKAHAAEIEEFKKSAGAASLKYDKEKWDAEVSNSIDGTVRNQ